MPRYRKISWPHVSPGCSTGSSSKAAEEKEPEAYTLRYVEDSFDSRTQLGTMLNCRRPYRMLKTVIRQGRSK